MSKRKEETQEEFDLRLTKISLELVRGYCAIPEPTILYKVGQRVRHGNIKYSEVTEVLDNGKIYKLHEVYTESNYGNPFDKERDTYVGWLDVFPYQSDEKIENITQIFEESDLNIHFCQTELRSLLFKHYHFGIDFNPNYQRGNIWDKKDKTNLLDSIFKGIDTGKIVLIKLPFKENAPSYEMLDGKQRMLALLEFYEGRITYKGFHFRDLHPKDRYHFNTHIIPLGEVDEEITQAKKYKYFLRMNTSGKPQDPEHLKYVEKLYLDEIKKGDKK